MKNYILFKDQLENGIEKEALKYSAGYVRKIDHMAGDAWLLDMWQIGARDSLFSIGQPIYNEKRELLGYLGIGLFENLNYSAPVKAPVEFWQICQPTEACRRGVKVLTYWHMKEEGEAE